MSFSSVYAFCAFKTLKQCQFLPSVYSKVVLTNSFSSQLATRQLQCRFFSLTSVHRYEYSPEKEELKEQKRLAKIAIDPSLDRSVVIPVETSIRYMKSKAYKECYGDDPVWKHYRRNHKGCFPPRKTRKLCIRNRIVSTGNPCPICRDEYLIVHHTNLDLLYQFISPTSGEILSYEVTGVCQIQHERLLIAFMRAKDLGLITFDVPFRKYDYSEYMENL